MRPCFRNGLCLLFTCFIITGCQSNNEDVSMPDEQNNNNRFLQVEDSDPAEKQSLNNSEIADRLASIASGVGNVNDASAVVAGPYAVVGIDVDKDLDRSRVGTIKFTVLEALQHDPYGKTAVVVADGDIMQRLRNMGDKIGQGYPAHGVVDELSAIIGRYMPDFPISDNQPKEPDQNKKVIPKEDKGKLDNIEEEQSNHKNKE
ncbi:YhcN/YlaJ family sporulation lipoprotein [Virgibacillus sp. DJP39]|uniref:YhcN/YlaJ family sporulation lipoprotein n=1 Tax=Virgibacillus sp. DJP39 TaxID=3409790 RepID=UPI003BB52FED